MSLKVSSIIVVMCLIWGMNREQSKCIYDKKRNRTKYVHRANETIIYLIFNAKLIHYFSSQITGPPPDPSTNWATYLAQCTWLPLQLIVNQLWCKHIWKSGKNWGITPFQPQTAYNATFPCFQLIYLLRESKLWSNEISTKSTTRWDFVCLHFHFPNIRIIQNGVTGNDGMTTSNQCL